MFVSALMITLIAVAAAPDTCVGGSGFSAVHCEGRYAHHLQGVCTDGREHIFWSFTTQLVQTDRQGRVQKQIAVANHHGDLCFHDGKIYVAVNLGRFNRPAGQADSWVYVYDAQTLEEVAKHKTPEVVHGAGGIAFHDGKFLVVGGLPEGVDENYAYVYDRSFQFQERHVVPSGYTLMGIQTAEFGDGHWWFGCYGSPQILLKVDPTFKQVERFEFDASLGITAAGDKRFLVGRGSCARDRGCAGWLVTAIVDREAGLVVQEEPAATK